MKGQVITNFITELPKKQAHLANHPGKQWTLHVDGVSKVSESGVGLIIQSPIGELMEQAIRFSFFAFNNEVEYEVFLAGLDLALVLATTKLEIRNDSQLIVRQIQREYEAKDKRIARYLAMVESHLEKLDGWVIQRVPREENGKADALVGISAILPIKEAVMLPVYLKIAPPITPKPMCNTSQTNLGLLLNIVKYLQIGEVPGEASAQTPNTSNTLHFN